MVRQVVLRGRVAEPMEVKVYSGISGPTIKTIDFGSYLEGCEVVRDPDRNINVNGIYGLIMDAANPGVALSELDHLAGYPQNVVVICGSFSTPGERTDGLSPEIGKALNALASREGVQVYSREDFVFRGF